MYEQKRRLGRAGQDGMVALNPRTERWILRKAEKDGLVALNPSMESWVLNKAEKDERWPRNKKVRNIWHSDEEAGLGIRSQISRVFETLQYNPNHWHS